ncbi:MAG: putative Ig domain-containing protein [Sulfuritalea sp.]|nr:putative Ig domain-containing protein [Sulfuritalea sp.]
MPSRIWTATTSLPTAPPACPAGLTINSSGVISGTLASSASQVGGGVYSVIVTATDSAGAPTSQTFSITVANPAPVAQADTGAVAEDATLTVSAANGVIVSGAASGGVDSDIDGDTLSVIGVTTGTAASVAAVGTGNVGGSLTGTYGTPDPERRRRLQLRRRPGRGGRTRRWRDGDGHLQLRP